MNKFTLKPFNKELTLVQPEISIAVISRTAARMSEFLKSVGHSTTLENNKIEVLCAWNGEDDYSEILVPSGINFRLEIIKPYNFAKNNNRLAEKAASKIIAFINDDVILDPNSLDHAMEALRNECVGIVGANLRYQDGRLQHAGVFFDSESGKPFHRLKGKVTYDDEAVSCSRFVPALTGAFLLMRLDEFISLKFRKTSRLLEKILFFAHPILTNSKENYFTRQMLLLYILKTRPEKPLATAIHHNPIWIEFWMPGVNIYLIKNSKFG